MASFCCSGIVFDFLWCLCPHLGQFSHYVILFSQYLIIWELIRYWGNNMKKGLFRLKSGVWVSTSLSSNPCSVFIFKFWFIGLFNLVGEIAFLV